MASISFTDEASESFANFLQHIEDYCVQVTPSEGEPFDAFVVGSAAEELDDFFAVKVWRCGRDGLRSADAPESLVVSDLKVY